MYVLRAINAFKLTIVEEYDGGVVLSQSSLYNMRKGITLDAEDRSIDSDVTEG